MRDSCIDASPQGSFRPGWDFAHRWVAGIQHSTVQVDAWLASRECVRIDVPSNLGRRVAHEWAFINAWVLEPDHLIRNSDLAHSIPDDPIHRFKISAGEVNDINRWLARL